MGGAKRELERRDVLIGTATDIAVEAGALARCEYHEDVTIDQGDSEAVSRAYAIGTNRWKAGEIDGSREELMDAIKSVTSEAADECYSCEKMFRDD